MYPKGRVTIQETMKIMTCLRCAHSQEVYICRPGMMDPLGMVLTHSEKTYFA